MDTLLRKYVEWKARRKAAQIIVFDGGAELDRARSFMRGSLVGFVLAVMVFALGAPRELSPMLLQEMERREALVHDARARTEQAVALTETCLATAGRMEWTLRSYQQLLGER